MLRAAAGACRILVANSNPIAWDHDIIAVTQRSGTASLWCSAAGLIRISRRG